MRSTARSILIAAISGIFYLSLGACQKEAQSPVPIQKQEIQRVVSDLQPWINVEQLAKAERKSFEQFCRFLTIRRHCDDAITAGDMTDTETVRATQPLIDGLAKLGAPTEDVLLRLLEARKGLDSPKRRQTFCNEDPEIYATIVLWNMRSVRAVPLLMELAQDKGIENRAVFVRGLGRIGDPKALDFLKDLAAKETDSEIQGEARTAAEAIEKRATPEKK